MKSPQKIARATGADVLVIDQRRESSGVGTTKG